MPLLSWILKPQLLWSTLVSASTKTICWLKIGFMAISQLVSINCKFFQQVSSTIWQAVRLQSLMSILWLKFVSTVLLVWILVLDSRLVWSVQVVLSSTLSLLSVNLFVILLRYTTQQQRNVNLFLLPQLLVFALSVLLCGMLRFLPVRNAHLRLLSTILLWKNVRLVL